MIQGYTLATFPKAAQYTYAQPERESGQAKEPCIIGGESGQAKEPCTLHLLLYIGYQRQI